jgi:hypothetical protein
LHLVVLPIPLHCRALSQAMDHHELTFVILSFEIICFY